MVPRRREMNGAEDDEDAARGDAGGIHRGDDRGGGDNDEGSASPEALDARIVRRRRDNREGERIDAEAHDEKAPRTGGEERNGEEVREEVDGDAPQADHQAPL